MLRRLAFVALVAVGCTKSASVECLNDRVCPEGTKCDEIHVTCVDPSQLETCLELADGTPCTYGDGEPGVCDQHVCIVRGCNNGYREDPEVCDKTDLPFTSCLQLGYYDDKPLTCNSACSYDESQCTGYCGDGMVTPGHEICDGSPPTLSCVDFGYGAGFLDCAQCGPDQKDCVLFGWHVAQMPSVLGDVQGTADNHVYAIALGTPLLYRYDGFEWLPVDLTSCALPQGYQMTQLWVVGNDVFIAGSQSIVLHVNASGCTKLPVDSGGTLYLTDIWASAPNDVYVTDEYAPGGIYHYDGTSFTQVSTVPRGRIWGSSSSDVWAVSVNNGTGDILHYDGTAWSSPTTLPGMNYETALWGGGPNDVYVAGRTTSNEPGVVHYNGSNWTPMPTPALIFSVYEGRTYQGRPFIAGATPSGGGLVAWFDGKTWVDMDADAAQQGASSLWISPTGKMYATSLGSNILTCDGTVRLDDVFPNAGGIASQVVADTADRMYAVVGNRFYEWDGTAWSFPTQPGSIITDLVLLPNHDLVAVSESNTGIYVRTSGSTTWTNYPAGPSGSTVWGSAPTDIWVSGPLGSNLTSVMEHWSGSAKDPACATCTSKHLFGVWGSASNDVFGVGYDGLIRHFDGSSWSDMTSGTTELLIDVWGTSASDVHAVGNHGAVLQYDGTAWSVLPKPPGDPALQTVWGTANDLFVAGPVNYVYHWDGAHWSPVDAHATAGIGSITGVGQTIVYVDFSPLAHRILRPVSW